MILSSRKGLECSLSDATGCICHSARGVRPHRRGHPSTPHPHMFWMWHSPKSGRRPGTAELSGEMGQPRASATWRSQAGRVWPPRREPGDTAVGRWGGCAPGPFPYELLITLWSSDSRSSRGCPPLPRGATAAGGARERGRGPAIRSARQEVVPHSLRIRCRPLPRVLPGTWVLLSLTFLLARHFRSLKTKISTILVNASLQFGALAKKFLCLSATEKLICSVSYYL